MEYCEAVERLYDVKQQAMEPGLERTERLLERLGNPETQFDAIQIAGSNGKGSTAAMLASILSESGLTVGLYTSPHLESFRERIQVNGIRISEAAVVRFVEQLADEFDERGAAGDSPTYFEALTTMALWYFAEEQVDVAILEVGLGGRYDATSVVNPIAGSVTSIAREHTQVLGDSIDEIARDKASIAPESGPFVVGATGEARSVICDAVPTATTVGIEPEADITISYTGLTDDFWGTFTIAGPDWSISSQAVLLGVEQAINAGIAATLAQLTWDIDPRVIDRGIQKTNWPGRTDILQRSPLVMLDGAHNPAACNHLADVIDTISCEDLHLVFGVLQDKDVPRMIDALPTPTSVVACKPQTPRAESPDAIARAFQNHGVERITRERKVTSAIERALTAAGPDDCILVTGSLSVIGEARHRWTRTFSPRRVESLASGERLLDHANVARDDRQTAASHTVHTTIRTSLHPDSAHRVQTIVTRCGGECVISAPERPGDPIEVVLMATAGEYDEITDRLNAESPALQQVAVELREALRENDRTHWKTWPWVDGPVLMGVVNVTPDSFHDGGDYATVDAAIDRAGTLINEGAAIIDIGGESTRPGGEPISPEEEIERVLPVIESVSELDALISIDTRKATVAQAALAAGADLINDVSGLSDPSMPAVASDFDVPLVLTHSIATPVDPSLEIEYDDVVREVRQELAELARRCERAGIDRSNLIVDPGIGFGKSPAENFALLARLSELSTLGMPVLFGHSHKSLFQHIGYDAGERLMPTVSATALAIERGADIVRVHDVAENRAALETAQMVRRSE